MKAAAFLITVLLAAPAHAAWEGVDETVVEGAAKTAGRSAQPLMGFMEGDLLLTAFLLAGAVGGFAAGYYFRGLFGREKEGR